MRVVNALALSFIFALSQIEASTQFNYRSTCTSARGAAWTKCVGTREYSDGSRYFGDFYNNLFHGTGRLVLADGSIFEGNFRSNQFHGFGTLVSADGSRYQGQFRSGKRDGYGELVFKDGRKYVGEFKEDRFNGRGSEFDANGTVTVSGIFLEGNLIEELAVDESERRRPGSKPEQSQTEQSPDVSPTRAGSLNEVNKESRIEAERLAQIERERVAQLERDQAAKERAKKAEADRLEAERLAQLERERVAQLERQQQTKKPSGQSHGDVTDAPAVSSSQSRDREEDLLRVALEREKLEAERAVAEAREIERRARETALQVEALERARKKREAAEAERVASENLRLDVERRRAAALAASSQTSSPTKTIIRSNKRIALVIANAAYPTQPLANPLNDGVDMTRALKESGFEVISLANASLLDIRRAVRAFADKLSSADVALIFYSGHGLEVKGRNYLIPVNADIQRDYEVEDQGYYIGQFTEMMESVPSALGQRVNILIVDACRDNPLVRSGRSAGRGLAKMDAPTGTLIAFSTAPGRVASDGSGRNSPFTKHLLRAIRQPNQPIEQVFKTVRRSVIEETNGEQVPWENSSLIGDFYFSEER